MHEKGFQIPKTHVCTWDAYLRWGQGDSTIADSIRGELVEKLDLSGSYAVRSSANVEDTNVHSFAGQFLTVLDVRGESEVLQAIQAVWSHVRSPSLKTYLEQVDLSGDEIKMAVLVQEMVTPVVSGVSFSKNPLTGMDEVIVEAVRGSGDALVQDGANPYRWVNKWGAWIKGDPTHSEEKSDQPQEEGIDLGLIEQVVQQTRDVAKAYGRPVDLEWVWDGETLYWVQLREITALNVNVYSNRISREVFPGLIKPLVWSVNVPLVNGAWVRLFTELIGPNDIDPHDLAKSFYYRAYFNMGAIGYIFGILGFPRESLELLMGIQAEGEDKPSFKPTSKTFRLLPRMLIAAVSKLGFARRIQPFLPAARARYNCIEAEPRDAADEQQLLQHVERLYTLTQEVAYYNIVTPLLMQIYNGMLKGQLGRVGVDYESLDLLKDAAELERYDPGPHLAALHRQYSALGAGTRARIDEMGYLALSQTPGVESFRSAVDQFIEQFGHLSDSGNDFSSVPWRETLDLVLDMVIQSPDQQNAQAAKDAAQLGYQDLDLPPVSKWFLRPLYRRARRFRLYREAVGSLYTYGYGLFRNAFLALGARFARRGLIESPEDVFWLNMDEVRGIVIEQSTKSMRSQVEQRKQEMERCQDIAPPEIIYGDEAPEVQAGASDKLEGTPTSRGRYSGPVRAVQGIQDLHRVQEGDVLVIPYADVGWTPLFTRAGAVIAESGGMLSHSSIIAREYNIPAVVSVANACRLANDTIVTVDGYQGEITIHGYAQPLENV